MPSLSLLFLFSACSFFSSSDERKQAPDPSLAAGGAGADAAAPAADTGDAGGDQKPVSCEPMNPIPAVTGPDCLSGSLSCGDRITSTTTGGSRAFDVERYEHSFCFPRFDTYSGPERVYELVLEPRRKHTITLESPCEDLDLVVLRWEDRARCPSPSDMISECEGDNKSGGASIPIMHTKAARYLVIVDGKKGEEAPFSLSVGCE